LSTGKIKAIPLLHPDSRRQNAAQKKKPDANSIPLLSQNILISLPPRFLIDQDFKERGQQGPFGDQLETGAFPIPADAQRLQGR
jgi:hypothetical protein